MTVRYGTAFSDVMRGTAEDDALYGRAGDDFLYGNGGSDRLYGGGGNDLLNGGAGADVLRGSLGNDTYVVDQPSDQIVESAGEGFDTVRAIGDYRVGRGISIEVLRTDDTGGTNPA
jgi:Ca2+-binding RTX toxin-like protein